MTQLVWWHSQYNGEIQKLFQTTNQSRFMAIPNLLPWYLVGGFNPSEKYQSVGSIIPNLWKIENISNHQRNTIWYPHYTCLGTPWFSNPSSDAAGPCWAPALAKMLVLSRFSFLSSLVLRGHGGWDFSLERHDLSSGGKTDTGSHQGRWIDAN